MKNLTLLISFCCLISSCGVSTNFNQRKYLDLKFHNQQKHEDLNEPIYDNLVDEVDVNPTIDCDTIKLKNGQIILAKIHDKTENKVFYTDCNTLISESDDNFYYKTIKLEEVAELVIEEIVIEEIEIEEITLEQERNDSLINSTKENNDDNQTQKHKHQRGKNIVRTGLVMLLISVIITALGIPLAYIGSPLVAIGALGVLISLIVIVIGVIIISNNSEKRAIKQNDETLMIKSSKKNILVGSIMSLSGIILFFTLSMTIGLPFWLFFVLIAAMVIGAIMFLIGCDKMIKIKKAKKKSIN